MTSCTGHTSGPAAYNTGIWLVIVIVADPQREADLLRHYTLSDEDLQNIDVRPPPPQQARFRAADVRPPLPGPPADPGEFVPPAVVDFIGRQLHLDGEELGDYAMRSETRHEHLAELRRLYGFRSFSGGAARELVERLREEGLGDLVSRAGGGLRVGFEQA